MEGGNSEKTGLEELLQRAETCEEETRTAQERALLARLSAEADQLKRRKEQQMQEWAARSVEEHDRDLKQNILLRMMHKIQPYQDRWDQKKRLLANEKRNMVNLPAQKHEQQFLIRVYLGDSTGQPLKPRVMRFMRISPDAQLAQLPLLFSSVFRSSSHPIKPGDCVVFWKGYQLSAVDLMEKEPSSMFRSIKETGGKPPLDNSLVVFLPEMNVDRFTSSSGDILRLTTAPLEESEMEAPNEKVSDDGNVDYSDKQGEQNDPTAFESQADEILAQVKAYSRSLARETQRRLYKLQNDFLTQLQEDLKNIEASTQNKCANYLGAVEACKIFEKEQEHIAEQKIETIKLEIERVERKIKALQAQKNKLAPQKVEVEWGQRTSSFRLDRFDAVMSTRNLMNLALSSFKFGGKVDAWFEDIEHYVLMTDFTEDLTVLFWGRPNIQLTLRIPEEENMQRMETKIMRDRAQKQAQKESEFKQHHGHPIRFDQIPWPHFIQANMSRLLATEFQYSVTTLSDAYDVLDATSNFTINQINKYYRKRMLFWHSDRFQYEFYPADAAKVRKACKLVVESYTIAHAKVKKEHNLEAADQANGEENEAETTDV